VFLIGLSSAFDKSPGPQVAESETFCNMIALREARRIIASKRKPARKPGM
jgi:hypothetical protein